ncbi:MAG: hypothetical protein ACK2T6_07300 [Anaerolineae bacterium]
MSRAFPALNASRVAVTSCGCAALLAFAATAAAGALSPEAAAAIGVPERFGAVASATVWASARGPSTTTDRVASPAQAPANDDLADAVAIGTLPFGDEHDNTGATDEPGEVRASCSGAADPEGGVWYSFSTAESGQIVVFDTEGSAAGDDDLDTVLSLWTGGPGHPLTEMECNDDASLGDRWSRIALEPQPNRTYYLKASGLSGATGAVHMNAYEAPSRPPNDDLANAIVIDGLPFIDAQLTEYATDEPGELPASCSDGEEPERGVWYVWQSTSAASVVFDTEGSSVDLGGGALDDMDTVLSVWTGGPGHPLTEVACSDDVGDELWSRVTLAAESSVTYFIKVGGMFGETGEAVLNVRNAAGAPANDDLASALVIDAVPFVDEQTTVSATTEPGEARASCGPEDVPERSVWYRLEPLVSGEFDIDTAGSDYDTVLSVWLDASSHPLTELACNDDGDTTLAGRLLMDLEAGRTYLIRVSAARGNGGHLRLAVSVAPERPVNDDLADAIDMDSLPFVDWQDTTHATDEPDEVPASCGSGGTGVADAGVWYRFAPDTSGSTELTTAGSMFDTVLSVWVGGRGHPLEEIACNDDAGGTWSTIELAYEAGSTYYIKAGGAAGERGLLSFGTPLGLVFMPFAAR